MSDHTISQIYAAYRRGASLDAIAEVWRTDRLHVNWAISVALLRGLA